MSVKKAVPYIKVTVAVVAAAAFVALICALGEPVYETNDDPGLAMVGAGFGQAVQPEAHLVYSHYAYGLLLNLLSRVIGPNAHGWVTLIAIGYSLALVIHAAMYAKRPRIAWVAVLSCIGCIYVGALLSAQYTITATLLFAAAIGSWLVATDEKRPKMALWMTPIVLALVLAFIIRSESYLLGVSVVLPLLLYLCWKRGPLAVPSRYLLGGIVIISIVGFAIDKIAYSACPEWNQVVEYNDVRAQFTDFDRIPWSFQEEAYRQVGWKQIDYYMFIAFYSCHPIYSLENISFLAKKLATPVEVFAPSRIGDWLSFPVRSWPIFLTLATQISVCFMLQKPRQLLGRLILLGELISILAVSLTGREALFRVWMSIATTSLIALIALWISAPRPRVGTRGTKIGLFLVTTLGILAAISVVVPHQEVRGQANAYRSWIAAHSELLRGKVAVWSDALAWEWLITPTRLYPPFPELTVATIDILSRTPIESTTLQHMGIDDIGRELCTDPDCRFVATDDQIQTFSAFCVEHYGIRPKFRNATSWGDYRIYVLDASPSLEQKP